MENKQVYGIKDTTGACLEDWGVCVPSEVACRNPQDYMFFDWVHPSTVAHEALAHKLYSGVRALLVQGRESTWGSG